MADIHTLKKSITEMSQDEAELLTGVHRSARVKPMPVGKSRQSKKRTKKAKKVVQSKPVKKDMATLLAMFDGDKEKLMEFLMNEG